MSCGKASEMSSIACATADLFAIVLLNHHGKATAMLRDLPAGGQERFKELYARNYPYGIVRFVSRSDFRVCVLGALALCASQSDQCSKIQNSKKARFGFRFLDLGFECFGLANTALFTFRYQLEDRVLCGQWSKGFGRRASGNWEMPLYRQLVTVEI